MDTALAEKMMLDTLARFELVSWTFKWSRSHRTLGDVSFQKKEIRLSKPLMEVCDTDQVLDTIRHEVAHILAGPGQGHGETWQEYARLLGATPEATAKGIPNPVSKYYAECSCGKTHERNRLASGILVCTRNREVLEWVDRKTGLRWVAARRPA